MYCFCPPTWQQLHHMKMLYTAFLPVLCIYHYHGCSRYNSHYLNSSAEQSQPTKLLTSSHCREEYSKMSVPWRTWVVEPPLVSEGTLYSPSWNLKNERRRKKTASIDWKNVLKLLVVRKTIMSSIFAF